MVKSPSIFRIIARCLTVSQNIELKGLLQVRNIFFDMNKNPGFTILIIMIYFISVIKPTLFRHIFVNNIFVSYA